MMTTQRIPSENYDANRRQSTRHRLRNRVHGFNAAIVAVLLLSLMAVSATAAPPIQSTQLGEVPTTGGLRPGPIGFSPIPAPPFTGELPAAIQIPDAQVDAEVETIGIVDGIMENPTGPWVVSWYRETARLGEVGNIVMAGHLDYWDVGPAVFFNIGKLTEGDAIRVTAGNGDVFNYQVDWVTLFDATQAPIQDIVGPTDTESLTLITCGGPFDYQNGIYLQRMVVRAHRVSA